jgi:hypothetical protein
LENAAQIMAMSIPEVARAIGCSREDAMARWLRCTEFVLSYTHAEMPRAIDVDVADASGFSCMLAAGFVAALATQDQRAAAERGGLPSEAAPLSEIVSWPVPPADE